MSVAKFGAAIVVALVLSGTSLALAEEQKGGQSAELGGVVSAPKSEGAQAAQPEGPPEAEKADLEYILGPGDQLDVAVWKDDALTRSLAVLPDGTISFPLIGELEAAGKSVPQLKKDLEAKLTRFLPEPNVSVNVRQVNSQLVYVLGRVNTPGRLMLSSNINVLQALAMAGGFNPFADRSNVKIIRYEGDKTKVIKFDYDYVVKKEKPELNFGLKRGDVIIVP